MIQKKTYLPRRNACLTPELWTMVAANNRKDRVTDNSWSGQIGTRGRLDNKDTEFSFPERLQTPQKIKVSWSCYFCLQIQCSMLNWNDNWQYWDYKYSIFCCTYEKKILHCKGKIRNHPSNKRKLIYIHRRFNIRVRICLLV